MPLPATIAVTSRCCTTCAARTRKGWRYSATPGEPLAARSRYAKTLYEGLKRHYGFDVKNFEVHAYAEPDHGDKSEALFRQVVGRAHIQHRCREAIRNTMIVRDARTKALNQLLDTK